MGLLSTCENQLQEKDLEEQLSKLEEEIKIQNKLITKRLDELSALKDESSFLVQLINNIKREETLILALHNVIKPIVLEEFDFSMTKEVLEYLRQIKPLNKVGCAEPPHAKLTFKYIFDSLKDIHSDDRNYILLSVNECIKVVDQACALLKINSSKILLEEERCKDKSAILSKATTELNTLYNSISYILKESLKLKTNPGPNHSLGELNKEVYRLKAEYFQTLDSFSKQIQNLAFSTNANDHIRYSSEISRIQRDFYKKIVAIKEEYLPSLAIEPEEKNVLQSLASTLDVAFKKTFSFDEVIEVDFKHKKSSEQQISELIQALTQIKVTTYSHPKKDIYLKIIAVIKEAQADCIPFQKRNEKYLALNKKLTELRKEVKERLETLYNHPTYKTYCLIDDIKLLGSSTKGEDKILIPSLEKNCLAFITSKDIIHYSDIELMKMDFNNFVIQKQKALDPLNDKIKTKNRGYKESIERELNAKIDLLDRCEDDYKPYQLLFEYCHCQLKQLNRPMKESDFLNFYETEILTFNKLKTIKAELFGVGNNYDQYKKNLENNLNLEDKKQRQWQTINQLTTLLDDIDQDHGNLLSGLAPVLEQTKGAVQRLQRRIQDTLSVLRAHSEEARTIANFITAINQLGLKPEMINQLLETLEQSKNAYLENPCIKKEDFHRNIMLTITNFINDEDFTNMVAEAPSKHYMRLFLQFVNGILEFFSKLLPLKDNNKPQFFAEVPKKIQQCDIVLNAEKARAKLVELEQTLAAYKPPVPSY